MIERRFTKSAEVRAKGDDAKPGLEGYAAIFNEEYVLFQGYGMRLVETIKPGAFDRVLRERQDVRCLFNHDPNNVLGRTENRTLKLVQDQKGLTYDAELDARTHIAQDVRCFVQRGDVTGCSFAFNVSKQVTREEEIDNGKMTVYTREIEEFSDLYDVGPVTYPAYEGTSVGARTAVAFARELRSADWFEGLPAGIRARLEKKIEARADVVTGGDTPDGSGEDDQLEQKCNCRCDACADCSNKRSKPIPIDLARARMVTAQLDLEQ